MENKVAQELGVDEVGVSHRYGSLYDYLRNETELNRDVRKKLHEYTVFLYLLPIKVDSSKLDSQKLSFVPSRGRGSQTSWVPSLFVEPHLPPYPEEKLWSQFRAEYQYLRDPSGEVPTHHTKPDALLTVDGENELPWTANVSPQPINQSKLMRMASVGQVEALAKALGVDVEDMPDTYAETVSLIQTEAEKESPSELYENWIKFQNKAERIIECKHEPFDDGDFSQILWYGLAYKTDIVIISKHSISNRQFSHELEELPVDVKIVSGIDLSTDFNEAQSKLERVV